jgi:hypothetical protein
MVRAGKKQHQLSLIATRLCISLVLISASDLRMPAVRAGLTRTAGELVDLLKETLRSQSSAAA